MSINEPPAETRVKIAIVVWGDAVLGRTLVLLLRSSGYDASFMPASSIGEPEALRDVRLLLITPAPEPNAESQQALVSLLRNTPETAKTPVVKLAIEDSEGTTEGRAEDGLSYVVPWPSRIEELERQIDAALTQKPSEKGL